MKYKKSILLLLFVVLVIIILIILSLTNPKEEVISHQNVERLYSMLEVNNCNYFSVSETTTIEYLSKDILVYLIFNQMKKDNLLTDKISKKDYVVSAKKIIPVEFIPSTIDSFIFDGYVYQLQGDTIIRKKDQCEIRQYVSKLYEYTANDTSLELDVMAGYIESGVLYNLDGEALGNVTEDNLPTLLDKGTMQIYTYKMNNQNYQLTSINQK